MRISDWSSDVCSSDLHQEIPAGNRERTDRLVAVGRCEQRRRTAVGVVAGLAFAFQQHDLATFARQGITGTGAGDAAADNHNITTLGHHNPRRTQARQGRRQDSPALYTHYRATPVNRSEEHTSELQSLMRISYAVFCL